MQRYDLEAVNHYGFCTDYEMNKDEGGEWVKHDDAAARIAELEATLADALRHWQHGIGSLNNKWRIRMGEILGDAEGLAEEAARAAIAAVEGDTAKMAYPERPARADYDARDEAHATAYAPAAAPKPPGSARYGVGAGETRVITDHDAGDEHR